MLLCSVIKSYQLLVTCQASLSLSRSCPLCQRCHQTISSSVISFSSCHQSFSASESFPVGWLFASSVQSIRASSSASVLIMNISFRTDWFDFLTFQETLKCLIQHCNLKTSVLCCSAFFMVQLSHLYRTTGKIIVLMAWAFVVRLMSLLFNMLSSFVTAFLPSSKHLSWLQSPSTVILESKKRKSITASTFFPFYLPWEGNGNQLQHSCLKTPMDTGDWWATVHGVTKRLT